MDGGQGPGGIVTYEINDEGKLVDAETGEEYTPGPESQEGTLPQWLWDQHNASSQGVES